MPHVSDMWFLTTRVKEDERFAVAVPAEGGIMAIIQTYHNMEQLEMSEFL